MTVNGNGRLRWAVDMGWTGTWAVPDVLTEPPDEPDRRILVELACAGIGPGRDRVHGTSRPGTGSCPDWPGPRSWSRRGSGPGP